MTVVFKLLKELQHFRRSIPPEFALVWGQKLHDWNEEKERAGQKHRCIGQELASLYAGTK